MNSAMVFHLIQFLRRRPVRRLYDERLKAQWLHREELEDRQLRALWRLVDTTARHVPFYRNHYAERAIDASSITSLARFADHVPIMTKDRLRNNLPSLHADDRIRQLITHRTGGSSGQPLLFPRDSLSIAAFWADYLLTRSWWGVRPGDSLAKIWGNFTPPTTFLDAAVTRAKELVKSVAMNTFFLSAYEMSHENMARFAETLRRVKPRSIYGYSSALERFAVFVRDSATSLNLPGDSVVISTSEPLYPSRREMLRDVFGIPVTDEYGACELGFIAFECPAGTLHVLEQSTFVEVLDETGEARTEGVGEILVTSLCSYSVPLIRYRLGDVVRLSRSGCSCGRQGATLDAVEGRTWSLFRGLNGNTVYPDIIMRLVTTYAPGIARFQAIQDRLEHIDVRLEARHDILPEQRSAICEGLAERLGAGTIVDVQIVDKIEPERSGKFISVKSLVKHERPTGRLAPGK